MFCFVVFGPTLSAVPFLRRHIGCFLVFGSTLRLASLFFAFCEIGSSVYLFNRSAHSAGPVEWLFDCFLGWSFSYLAGGVRG